MDEESGEFDLEFNARPVSIKVCDFLCSTTEPLICSEEVLLIIF